MCVSRSQRAKHSFGRLGSFTSEALLALSAMELVTVTEGQGAVACGRGTDAGASGTGAVPGAGIDTVAGGGGAAACGSSAGHARAFIADAERSSATVCVCSTC